MSETPMVLSLHKSATHSMEKFASDSLKLITDFGVEGDVHAGATVKHRSRLLTQKHKPNLRQVHLIGKELHDELAEKGFEVKPGQMGENILTKDIDLMALPEGSMLQIGEEVELVIQGIRNPCKQLNGIHKGLMKAVLDKDSEGNLIRKAGVMATVKKGGWIHRNDKIHVTYPPQPHKALVCV